MTDFVRDFWLFMKERRKFWLGPFLIVILGLGALIMFTQSTAVAPLIYTLF